ncbi:hypothetical protein GCM10016272_01590 [Psychrobacter glaciei]|uniref:Helix-turn-helix domain-containing protein n=1 Tax=Psychrobacter glaciei TaxID=619771 RepID=A0ABQ3GND9_9GAMM|nr:hypothetical protein [Psychrobacter glaciei]GHD25590.1 hypothetical protein GCM10016272_01590 [Psychrobacter glaciei]
MHDLHRAKEKKMAYLLHYEFGYPKSAIATLMKISPQQMGAWIKEMDYEVRIHNLTTELTDVKNELMRLGYSPQKPLNHDDFTQF